MSKRCLVVPDLQHGPGRPTRHLVALSRLIADKQPDIVVQIGDLGDFASLSSYDRGKASAENKRLSKDWDAFRRAVDLFSSRWEYGYKPRLIYCEGNHEERIRRYANDNPSIDTLPDPCGEMRNRGWEAYPFLTVARVEGVQVSHLFPRTMTGRVTATSMRYGAPSANAQIRANMVSCVAGHKPGFDYSMYSTGTRTLHGLIAGSFYLHDESYNGPGGDRHWRGVVFLNQLRQGEFDVCPVRMKYLLEKYR